jgi:NAD(P)-dependent dehydrogenase (short-subunit alcohol dehydrogenase family)
LEDIRNASSVPLESNQLIFVPTLDLGDFSSIREAVDILLFENSINKIDIVISNAGVMMGTKTKSKDVYELMMNAGQSFGPLSLDPTLVAASSKGCKDRVCYFFDTRLREGWF